MVRSFKSYEDIQNHDFDTVIDVRSPAEFEEDHIPGAINLPSLSNKERAEVGTIYKQISPFKARKVGASLVLQNVARHLSGPLHAYDGGWRPLIYCWRGGQRSGVFSTLLKEIGWRAETIAGGYQTYRRIVQNLLYEEPLQHRFILLDGYTGTAKTAVLGSLAKRGVQVIDLEGLAGHRGSLLGEMPDGQPSQRMFETRLAAALNSLDPTRPTLLEAESSKIGRLNMPPSVWAQMIAAPRIRIDVPLEARVAFITDTYREILADPYTVTTRLAPLRRLRGHEKVDHWHALQTQGDLAGLAQALITDHYDPAYARAQKKRVANFVASVGTQTLDTYGLEEMADQLVEVINGQ